MPHFLTANNMKVQNVETELGVASYQLKIKRYLDQPGGTSLEDFQTQLRSAIHKARLEKAPAGVALNPEDKFANLTIPAQRLFKAQRKSQMEFEFKLNTETNALSLQKMTMELNSKPGQPLVWQKASGQKLPPADKAFFLIEGVKHQDDLRPRGRQIRGGHQNNNRKM